MSRLVSTSQLSSAALQTTATVALTAVAAGLVGICSSLARARRQRSAASPSPSPSPSPPLPLLSSTSPTSLSPTPAATGSGSLEVQVPRSPMEWSFSFPNVRFNSQFFTKLSRMQADGAGRTVAIVDFDWTLSGYKNTVGNICKTSYGVLTSSPLTDEKFRSDSVEIKGKYFPYERDTSLSVAARSCLMEKWWNEIHQLMIAYGYNHSLVEASIKLAVEQNHLFLRAGATEFLRALHVAHTPLLVMSAGLHQTVETTLRLNGVFFDNTEVCANLMRFDDSGKLHSFSPSPPIHSFNKSFAAVSAHSKFREHCDRFTYHAVVVGDSSGDVNMSSGMNGNGERLNIGFVNSEIDKRTVEFLEVYDAVILNDGSWDLVLTVLRSLNIIHTTTTATSATLPAAAVATISLPSLTSQ